MEKQELKRVIEALLFVTDKPLTLDQIKLAVEDADAGAIRRALDEVAADYDARGAGLRVKALAGGWQFVTDASVQEYLRKWLQSRQKKRVSQASLETLSIIAYKQPITRAEIEHIRGVNVDGAVRTLLEKGLIRPAGRKDVPGRPILYATTREFLDHFGLGALKDLPKLEEFTERDLELPGEPETENTTDEKAGSVPQERR